MHFDLETRSILVLHFCSVYARLPPVSFTWACLEDSGQRRGQREGPGDRRLNRLILMGQRRLLEGGKFGSRNLAGC